MPKFQFIISNPETRKAYKIEVDQDRATGIVGKKIREDFNGDIIGLSGYKLQITGGTDKDGFPMHPQVHGPGRKKVILAHPPGFHPRMKGQRKRKMVRGNTISKDIVQINCKVLEKGKKPIQELIVKVEAKPEEKPKEEKVKKKEEVKVEEKPGKKPKTEKKEEKRKEPEKKPKEKPKEEAKPEKKVEPKKEKEKK